MYQKDILLLCPKAEVLNVDAGVQTRARLRLGCQVLYGINDELKLV